MDFSALTWWQIVLIIAFGLGTGGGGGLITLLITTYFKKQTDDRIQDREDSQAANKQLSSLYEMLRQDFMEMKKELKEEKAKRAEAENKLVLIASTQTRNITRINSIERLISEKQLELRETGKKQSGHRSD